MDTNATNPQDAGVTNDAPMSVVDARSALEGLLGDEPGTPDDTDSTKEPEAEAATEAAEEPEADKAEGEGDEDSQEDAAEGDDDTEATDDGEDEQGDDETPAIDPPIGMSAEEKAAWEKLPREQQEFVAKQEKARTADYQRKTQALAEQRKEAEAAKTQVEQQRQQYAENLTIVQNMIESSLQADPQEMQRLYNENPTEWVRMNELQRQGQEKLKAVQGEMQRLRQQAEQEHQKQLQTELQDAARRLPELIPDWSNAETAKAEKAQLSSWLMEQGFTREQLAQNTNPHLIAMARKAMLFDRQQATKRTAKEKAAAAPTPAKTAKPQASKRTSPNRSPDPATKDSQRFRQKPTRDNAAKLLESLIPD